MTWSTFLITPLVLALTSIEPDNGGTGVKQDTLWLEWLVDISWSVEIVLNFLTVDDKARTLRACARRYIRGWFIFDIVATVPPIMYR